VRRPAHDDRRLGRHRYAEIVQRLFALAVLTVIVEVTVIIEVGQRIGAFNTVGLLILVSALGAVIVKAEGLTALRRAITDLEDRQVPGAALADAALLAAAGALVLIPGFVTDVFGLLLLVPPVRSGVRRVLRRRWSKRFVVQGYELEA
jgi:UPF0716 protein FxsA